MYLNLVLSLPPPPPPQKQEQQQQQHESVQNIGHSTGNY